MIWEHFPDLSWLLWYCTEQEVARSAPRKSGRYKISLQLGEAVSDASLLGSLLGFAICCSFCLWKDVPKVEVHGEDPAWIHCRRGGMRKHKAKHCRARTPLCALPRPFWHLYVIVKKRGRAVEKTAGTLVSFSSKCPRYLSFTLQLALDVKRWEVLWRRQNYSHFPVFSLYLSTFHLSHPHRNPPLLLGRLQRPNDVSACRSKGLDTKPKNPSVPFSLVKVQLLLHPFRRVNHLHLGCVSTHQPVRHLFPLHLNTPCTSCCSKGAHHTEQQLFPESKYHTGSFCFVPVIV